MTEKDLYELAKSCKMKTSIKPRTDVALTARSPRRLAR